jgi:pimeloyl-ACP methyl ester carboxylesterase
MPLAPRALTRRRSQRPAPKWAPEPPVAMPPARIVHVPGRGEFFVRDSGGDGTPVLLLHGWMFSADLNWFRNYQALIDAGYRVIAMDHRGHGRGLRTIEPFRLELCAGDAAAVLRELEAGPVIATGYSMGGPIAQFLARDHPDSLRGLVLGATALSWRTPRQKLLWNGLAFVRVLLGLAPDTFWRRGLRLAGFPDSAATTWMTAELTRGSARDLAEAGHELARFDSSGWIGSVAKPVSVIVTTKDRGVPPKTQRALAKAARAETFEVRGDHDAVATKPEFNDALLRAVRSVEDRAPQPEVARS